MIKAIFMDYTGTMVREDEPYTIELVKYFIEHSDLKTPKDVLGAVWSKVKDIESTCFGDDFILNDEKVDRILAFCCENYGLQGDLQYMHETWQKIWVYAPLFEDVEPAKNLGITPIYLARKGTVVLDGVTVIKSLDEYVG